ncbi:MAG: VOC family protein [Candidatus Babeliales bacterium]
MITFNLGFLTLFVKNPSVSAAFYSKFFNVQPIKQDPLGVMFKLDNGTILCLISRYTAQPMVHNEPGAAEICFAVENVDALFDEWGKQGVTIVQKVTDMDFARTFTAQDPDGHRIKLYQLYAKK